jgi:hypothetical protein
MTTIRFNAVPARGWSPLHSLSRVGISLISLLAANDSSSGQGTGGATGSGTGGHSKQALSATATAAVASGAPLVQSAQLDHGCCQPWFPNGPYCQYTGGPQHFTCPDGSYQYWWYCCQGTQRWGCGECTKSHIDCWHGDWTCSTWWQEGSC